MGMTCEVSAVSSEDIERLAEGEDFYDGLTEPSTATASGVCVEKAWHGLHYLLTGEVDEGRGPLAFLLAGGEHLEGDEEAPRWFTPEETAAIEQSLSAVSSDQLWARFDPSRMEQLGVYPNIWDEDEDDLKHEYVGYFEELKRVVVAAAQSGQGLLVDIG